MYIKRHAEHLIETPIQPETVSGRLSGRTDKTDAEEEEYEE